MSRVLLAVPLVLPLLIVVLHRFGSSGSSPGGGPGSAPLPVVPKNAVPTPPPAPVAGPGDPSTQLGLTRILCGLGLALLAVAVVLAVLHLWRYLTRPPAPEPPAATYAMLDGERESLAQAVDSGRRALLDATDIRAAVIACYRAMEESLADSGVARCPSDSPQDLLERAVDGGLPAGAAAADDGHRHGAAAARGHRSRPAPAGAWARSRGGGDVKARTQSRALINSVLQEPGSVRHSLAVLAAVAIAAEVLLALADGAALVTSVALALGRYAAGGAAQDRGNRRPRRLLGSRAPALGRWRRMVADTLADDSEVHFRTVMRPQLQRLFAARLAERHGVDMYRNTRGARALVGTELWPWIDPEATVPEPTLPEPVLRSLPDRLEAL